MTDLSIFIMQSLEEHRFPLNFVEIDLAVLHQQYPQNPKTSSPHFQTHTREVHGIGFSAHIF
jgi:hypothetical protein